MKSTKFRDKIGYIGLGKMGKNMVMHLLEQKVKVVAWNRSPEPLEEVAKAGAISAKDLSDLVSKLTTPRVVWLMLPAGEVVDDFIERLSTLLTRGDLVIDGGNSFYKDTLKRAKRLHKKGIRFMDIGTSGGPGGARVGACLMIGGDQTDYQRLIPLFESIAAPGAFGYFGPVGSGHFTKMVHNGIEYGMMEAIAEGTAVLKYSQFKLNLAEIFRVYNNRSVIESRLVGWVQEALAEDPNLKSISSQIKSTGEGEWTIKTAHELDIPVPVIESSLEVRQSSINDTEDSSAGFRNKVVSVMRGKFGQHQVQK